MPLSKISLNEDIISIFALLNVKVICNAVYVVSVQSVYLERDAQKKLFTSRMHVVLRTFFLRYTSNTSASKS